MGTGKVEVFSPVRGSFHRGEYIDLSPFGSLQYLGPGVIKDIGKGAPNAFSQKLYIVCSHAPVNPLFISKVKGRPVGRRADTEDIASGGKPGPFLLGKGDLLLFNTGGEEKD